MKTDAPKMFTQSPLRLGNKLIMTDQPLIMGILNVTPDSFYDGGRYLSDEMARVQANRLMEEGADILDVGACSSRPGAVEPDASEERERLDMALSVIRSDFPEAVLSVDTYRSSIAEWAIKNYNVQVINDISGGNLDPDMFLTAGRNRTVYILMHMLGNPRIMQENPVYSDVIGDISHFFSDRINRLTDAGVMDIWIDPGFGFGKTLDHNYDLLAGLNRFRIFDRPIVVGVSRKSMIYKVLNGVPETSLNGTSVLHTAALLKGADVLRTHDVKQAKECIQLVNRLTA